MVFTHARVQEEYELAADELSGVRDTYLFSDPVVNRNSYAQICRYLGNDARTHIIAPPPSMGFGTRAICKAYDTAMQLPVRNKAISYHEMKFDLANFPFAKDGVFHFLFGDSHVEFLARRKKAKNQKLIFTVHQPFASWTPQSIQALRNLDGLITMCEPDGSQFAQALPEVTVESIPHGVDIDYWAPRAVPETTPKKRVGYCGRHLRNVPMFIRVAERALRERDDVQFECLITAGGMNKAWEDFGKNPNVHLMQGLDQDQVRDFYRSLYAFLMPLDDTTANNAIVESLSCGVPIVTTRVGGIGSYGGGEVYPAVENNDDDALYAEICRYLDDPELCKSAGLECRRYAETDLAWPLMVSRHRSFYQRICSA